MEEAEVPTETLQEHIHHSAEHAREKWISQVALSTAILAVFAALAALLSGHHANEAMIEQIHSSDRWSYYQAKGIKAGVLRTKLDMLAALGKPVSAGELSKLQQYHDEQEKIAGEAKEKEEEAQSHLNAHMVFARAVTLYQISIAICAVSALIRRRHFWLTGLAFGAVGLFFLVQGLWLVVHV